MTQPRGPPRLGQRQPGCCGAVGLGASCGDTAVRALPADSERERLEFSLFPKVGCISAELAPVVFCAGVFRELCASAACDWLYSD